MDKMDLKKYGITGVTEIVYNPSYDELFREETKKGLRGYEKGQLTETGAVNVMTGVYTGRSPKDKFFVMDETTKDTIWWTSDEYKNDNKPVTKKAWKELKKIAVEELSGKKLFVVGHQLAGHDPFDSRNHELVRKRLGERLERRLQVDRRNGQHDHLGRADRLVQIVGGPQTTGVETHVAQIARIGLVAANGLQHLAVADVPAYGCLVLEQYLDQSGRPAAVSDHGAAGLPVDSESHAKKFRVRQMYELIR